MEYASELADRRLVRLHAEITETERAMWQDGMVRDWANESLAITRQANVSYCVEVDGTCRYTQDNEQLNERETQKTVTVDGAYLNVHVPSVRERLKQGGVRLGMMLNRALGQ